MILKALSERAGQIVTREEILDRVWGYEVFPSTRTIDNFIVRLRKRFERNPEAPAHFHTVRGVGYRFTRGPAADGGHGRMSGARDGLLMKTIRREPMPRRPLWIMRQAGRYLPEYREFREKHSFKALAGDPALAAEVTLMPLKRFALDAAIVFADIMSPLPALGIEFDFAPGPVVAKPIRDGHALERSRDPAPEEIAPEVIEALKLTRAALPASTALLGFCGAPWTLAAYLVEGKGTKDFPTLRAFAAAEPLLLDRLLARLTSLQIDYLRRQAAAGADAVQIFDSWAGLLSRASWEKLIRPHLTRCSRPPAAPRFRASCSCRTRRIWSTPTRAFPQRCSRSTGASISPRCRQSYPDRAVQGNLEPAILIAGADATRAAARELLAATAPRGHIVNLGHGILPQTPIASVEALIETVHSEDL